MPARTNVRLSMGKSINKSGTTSSSQLGTFLWNMTVGQYTAHCTEKIVSVRYARWFCVSRKGGTG